MTRSAIVRPRSGEIALREHDDGQDDQKYDHDADGDVGQPVGFPVQAALK